MEISYVNQKEITWCMTGFEMVQYVSSGLTAIPRFAGIVHGVVVQITSLTSLITLSLLATAAEGSNIGKAT